MDNQPSVLIYSRSEQMRSSLEVLITSSARVKSVRLEGEMTSINHLASYYKPALVVMAFQSPDGSIRDTLGKIKATWPQTPAIVLVDSEHERLEILSAGAEAVLVKGILAAHLLMVVEDLLF